MKITLCVFLSITGSVYGQVKLHERVGRSVEFPTEVKNSGNMMYLSKVIAHVISGARRPLSNEYDSRLQWDNRTGLFSLSGLKMEDKGEYKVVRNDGTPVEVKYQLKVYVPVSKPHISVISNKYRCKLKCTVERGTDVNLTLYREGEEEPYSSSDPLDAPYLKLPVPVEGGTYTCEANNSVSTERSAPLTVGDHCTDGAAGSWQTEGCRVWSLALGLVVMLNSLLV
ncbi:SLAM family member 9-like isoform X2 [Conger conger]|uniref:SLAM family member 9-like isoform X2 n=1 Tax=Conger conger TaxID=82655 RepID=UPI002A5A964A|nr:SLAM family member 9-like isoform X2 [Conger conger]